MSEEAKDKMLEVAKILFKNNVPIEQAKFIGDFIETQNNKLQQKENIIKEVREYCNLHLKTAKEVIIESEKWLEVEEQADFAKKDIHTAKVVKRNLEDILEILDKEVN